MRNHSSKEKVIKIGEGTLIRIPETLILLKVVHKPERKTPAHPFDNNLTDIEPEYWKLYFETENGAKVSEFISKKVYDEIKEWMKTLELE